MRSTGASRWSKAASWIWAAISAPSPPKVTASCTTSTRLVRRTEANIVSVSRGCTVRGSITSISTPSAASSSAAARASPTMRPRAITVTSLPWRAVCAWPSGMP